MRCIKIHRISESFRYLLHVGIRADQDRTTEFCRKIQFVGKSKVQQRRMVSI